MSDLISREEAINAIRKSASKFSGFMEMEIYTVDDAITAVNTVPSAEPMSGNTRKNKADELREQLHYCDVYIAELETKCKDLKELNAKLEAECKDLKEKLHEAELAVEHNRHVADEEQLRGALRYRDGVIHGLKYATRCNGVSGGEVDQ